MVVQTGLENLLKNRLYLVKGKRIGLLTNASAVTADLVPNVDALRAAGVNIVSLFGPEHGYTASAPAGADVPPARDPRTGLPVYSMAGAARPTLETVGDLDLFIIDLPCIGTRAHPYPTNIALALDSCARIGLRVLVLDRPNPINGAIVEGPLQESGVQLVFGTGPVPLRHSLTIGELAQFYNRETGIGADLDVVPLVDWKREMWFDETRLEWVPPAPNLPQLLSLTLYPGMCLLDGTSLLAGRGTSLPYQLAGAPWVDGHLLADELNALGLRGVRFRPATFVATVKGSPQECSGVQVHVTDRRVFRPVRVALEILSLVQGLWPGDFEWRADRFDQLAGTNRVRCALDQGAAPAQIVASWAEEQRRFLDRRARYLLY